MRIQGQAIGGSHRRLRLVMIAAVSVCAAAACSKQGTSPVTSAPPPPAVELTILSFNIRYGTAPDGENAWPERRELVFDVIERHDPDVIGLQEALRSQLDEIRARFPGYVELGVGRRDGKESGEYAAILYRSSRLRAEESGTFWFSDTPDFPGSRHWGNSITRICTWARLIDMRSGAAFAVYNVHLDHRSQPSRARSTLLLAERIASRTPADPVIVTGDFNAGEGNPAIQYLRGERDSPLSDTNDHAPSLASPRLRDTYRVVHPDELLVGTFNGFEGSRTGKKIDYVFVGSGLRVKDASIVHDSTNGRYPSDHFPVLAVVELVARAEGE